MGICFTLFGFSSKIEDPTTLTIVALTLRAMQGVSSALIQTTCYSIATNDFPDKKEAMIGYIEAATGLGLVVGPIVGSMVFSQLGYSGAFFFCGGFICIFAVLSAYCGESTRQSTSERQPLLSQEPTSPMKPTEKRKLSISNLLLDPRFTLAGLAASLTYFAYTAMEPILA